MSVVSGISLAYQTIIQRINVANQILGTTPVEMTVPLPDGMTNDGVYAVPNGAVDQVLDLMTSGLTPDQQFVDFIFLFIDQEISFKLQGVGSTPIPVRAKGIALL